MKLDIRKTYFDKIKNGEKTVEYRDAHLTLRCIETNETLRVEVESCCVKPRVVLPEELKHSDMFEDKKIIAFRIKSGLCQKHYQRYRKYGSPLLTKIKDGSSFVLVEDTAQESGHILQELQPKRRTAFKGLNV